MGRQPLLQVGSGYAAIENALAHRPKAAALIAECIAYWTQVEHQIGRLLAAMLHANTEPVIALYFTLANERAKRECLTSIADYVFSENDRTLFDVIFKAKASVAAQRNDLAHGLYCVVFDEPDGIGWMSTKAGIKFSIQSDVAEMQGLPGDYRSIEKNMFIYKLKDIEQIKSDIGALHMIICQFRKYLITEEKEPSRAELYQKILNAPLLLQFRSPTGASPKNGS